jgi:hypothetical protein
MDGSFGTRRGLSQQSREFALLAPPSVVAWGNPLRKKKVFRDSQAGGRPFRGGGGKLTETTGKDRRCPGPPKVAREGASQERIFVFAFSVMPPSRTSARRGAPAVARFGRPGFQRQAPDLSTNARRGIRRQICWKRPLAGGRDDGPGEKLSHPSRPAAQAGARRGRSPDG